jgi:hypothetical protein
MRVRVPQPPVNPASRAREFHDFWPAFAVALAGLALFFCGARHLTTVDTVAGGNAWESQLIKAFSTGGIQYANRLPPLPPPDISDAANPAELLDRWTKARLIAQPSWKIRVDVGAQTPCPT